MEVEIKVEMNGKNCVWEWKKKSKFDMFWCDDIDFYVMCAYVCV